MFKFGRNAVLASVVLFSAVPVLGDDSCKNVRDDTIFSTGSCNNQYCGLWDSKHNKKYRDVKKQIEKRTEKKIKGLPENVFCGDRASAKGTEWGGRNLGKRFYVEVNESSSALSDGYNFSW